MPLYCAIHLKTMPNLTLSCYYSDFCTVDYNNKMNERNNENSSIYLSFNVGEDSILNIFNQYINIEIGKISVFNMRFDNLISLLNSCSNRYYTGYLFICNKKFMDEIKKFKNTDLHIIEGFDFNDLNSFTLLIRYLETNGISVEHLVDKISNKPETDNTVEISNQLYKNIEILPWFYQLINKTSTEMGKNELLSRIINPPNTVLIQESFNFIKTFTNYPNIKKIAEILKKIRPFNTTVTEKTSELGLGTSFIMESSINNLKSIYSKGNLEENSIKKYKKLIKNVENIKMNMLTIEELKKGLLKIEDSGSIKNEILVGIIDTLKSNKIQEINKKLILVNNKQEGVYSILADKIGYVIKNGIDPYLDLCRNMYDRKIKSCEEIIRSIQLNNEVDIYLGDDREICLMCSNNQNNIKNKKINSTSSNVYKLIVLSESKTMILYTCKELKIFNKSIRDILDQINEIQGRICKSILIEISKFNDFIDKITYEVARIDFLISNLFISNKIEFKQPKLSKNTRILNATHLLFPDYFKSSYIFEKNEVYVITGPNMAGKSCYLRNFAQIVFLSKIGCFVECESIEIPQFDETYFINSIDQINILSNKILEKDPDIEKGYKTPKRLVLIDELHLSFEIQIDFLNLLQKSHILTLLVTHNTRLINQLDQMNYKIFLYENYQLKSGINTKSNVLKICERFFPELKKELENEN